MKSIEPDVLAEVNAAYRLGRDRFTLRMWQELAWTWDVSDENVIQSVDISLVDLLHWLDQLKDVIDLLAAIDIKQWVERFFTSGRPTADQKSILTTSLMASSYQPTTCSPEIHFTTTCRICCESPTRLTCWHLGGATSEGGSQLVRSLAGANT